MNNFRTTHNQNGSALLVSLVILVVVTILALGSMSDVNLQLSLARNAQLSKAAFEVAHSELDFQQDSINANAPGADDSILVQLVNFNEVGDILDSTDPSLEDLPEPSGRLSNINNRPGAAAFNRTLTYALSCDTSVANKCPPIPNFSINTFNSIGMIINSAANIPNTAAQSNQSAGYLYLVP